jgi:hypothetical protein
MSKLIASAAIRGAHKIVGQADRWAFPIPPIIYP